MKRRLLFFAILILTLSALGAARGEARDYVRLHVAAADDTLAAQALKLEVRDAVLAQARGLLSGAADADGAWRRVKDSLPALEAAATAAARAAGYGGGVACEAGVFDFPDRRYGDTLLPAGRYRALRVVIGAGEGHNWWCVLYPDLCYPKGVDPESPRFRSAILEWLRSLFGGGAS